MWILPAMPETGGPGTRQNAEMPVTNDVWRRSLCGGLDMDIVFKRLFDDRPEVRP